LSESVREFLKEQRLPLIISALALLLAISIGLVPVLNAENEQTAVRQSGSEDELAALNERLAALESAALNSGGEISPTLRAELDLIGKGLLNQTGRVSRLKKQIATPAGGSDGISPALRAELDLIGKGLLNQTGRVSRLKKQIAIPGNSDAIGMSPELRAELDLMAKGLLNQTSRVSALRKQVASLASLPDTLKRIDLEVINLTKAIGQLHQRFRSLQPESPAVTGELTELRDHLATIQTQMDAVRASIASVTKQFDVSVANGTVEAGALTAIETKLDRILQSITE